MSRSSETLLTFKSYSRSVSASSSTLRKSTSCFCGLRWRQKRADSAPPVRPLGLLEQLAHIVAER